MTDSSEHAAALGRLLALTVLLGEDMTRGLAELGLTGPRAHLLFVLQEQGPSTQRALAEALAVSPRNVTGLVDGLVATGFVRRGRHPGDRRAILVEFTEHGAEVAAGLERGRDQLAADLFADMPAERFEGLVRGLDAVLARLHELLAAAR